MIKLSNILLKNHASLAALAVVEFLKDSTQNFRKYLPLAISSDSRLSMTLSRLLSRDLIKSKS